MATLQDKFFSTAVLTLFPAARMAREAINKNSSILRDYKLKLLVADGQCRADVVMKTFIDYIYLDMYPKLVGVLGNQTLSLNHNVIRQLQ